MTDFYMGALIVRFFVPSAQAVGGFVLAVLILLMLYLLFRDVFLNFEEKSGGPSQQS